MTASAVLHLIHVALVVSLVGSIGYVVGEFIVKRFKRGENNGVAESRNG